MGKKGGSSVLRAQGQLLWRSFAQEHQSLDGVAVLQRERALELEALDFELQFVRLVLRLLDFFLQVAEGRDRSRGGRILLGNLG